MCSCPPQPTWLSLFHLPFLTLAVAIFLTFYKRRLTLTYWRLRLFGECQIYKLKIDCHLLVFIGVVWRLNDGCGLFGEQFFLLHIKYCFSREQLQEFAFCSVKLQSRILALSSSEKWKKAFLYAIFSVLILLCKVVLRTSKPIIFRRFVLGAWNKLHNAKCVVALV